MIRAMTVMLTTALLAGCAFEPGDEPIDQIDQTAQEQETRAPISAMGGGVGEVDVCGNGPRNHIRIVNEGLLNESAQQQVGRVATQTR